MQPFFLCRALLSSLLAGLFCLSLPIPMAIGAPEAPSPTLPNLTERSPSEVQATWMKLKSLPPSRQLLAVQKERPALLFCRGLLDSRTLIKSHAIRGFAYRDDHRKRSFVRPSLALLLTESMTAFRKELEAEGQDEIVLDKLVSIGDIAQEGCGQVAHGSLVYMADTAFQKKLEESALQKAERLISEEILSASHYMNELSRFVSPFQKVLVEYELMGLHEGRLRYTERRYSESKFDPDEWAKLKKDLRSLTKRKPVLLQKTSYAFEKGHAEERYLAHYIDMKKRQQAIFILKKKPKKGIPWDALIELRFSKWQNKKPGSMPEEVRYIPMEALRKRFPELSSPQKEEAPISKWSQVYEAGHISHLSGIDVDLSWVTKKSEHHFAVDLPAIHWELTWRWLKTLEAKSQELEIPIEVIFIGPAVYKQLAEFLRSSQEYQGFQTSSLWSLIKPLSGHDSHHHLRVEELPEQKEAAFLERLENEQAKEVPESPLDLP